MNSGLRRVVRLLTSKEYRFLYRSYLGLCDKWDDERFIKRKFRAIMGYEPNLDNPETFNEKINWLKLHDRKLEYIDLVDKYKVKEIVAREIGEQYITPNLGIWDRAEDIDFESLPDRFVLKCTHDSGSRVICKDKSNLDFAKARSEMAKSLGHDYYKLNREWPYKDVERKILAEEYIDSEGGVLNDYRFYCFNGDPKFFSIDFVLGSDIRVNFYDKNLTLLSFGAAEEPPIPEYDFKLPENIGTMFDIARKLSKGKVFIRVDMYNINGEIRFSELTFFSYGGFMALYPDRSWDEKLGEMLDLDRR